METQWSTFVERAEPQQPGLLRPDNVCYRLAMICRVRVAAWAQVDFSAASRCADDELFARAKHCAAKQRCHAGELVRA